MLDYLIYNVIILSVTKFSETLISCSYNDLFAISIFFELLTIYV